MEIYLCAGFNLFWRARVLVIMLLVWSIPAVLTQSDFLNIDCGATSKFFDSVTGLSWEPDAPYISSGKTQTLTLPSSLQNFTEMQTLRYFDDARAKNCYALPVTSSGIYLLKLSFFYGDYNNANLPPKFQVAIDANIISNISFDATGVSLQEYHYMSQGNVTYVCLIRTSPGATPFISGISLKEASMLASGHAKQYTTFLQEGIIMTTRNRLNFGGLAPIRAPADYYDRLWIPSTDYYLTPSVAGSYQFLSTTTISNLTGDKFWPPSAVMQSAVTRLGLGPLESFLLPEGSPAIDSTSVYISFYFAELNSSASRPPLRNFTIHPDLAYMGTVDIDMSGYNFLGYLNWDFWQKGVSLGKSTTVILTPLASAKAGPILNCMEIFARSEARIAKTADQDALAIEDIKSSLNLTEWSGDPCLPSPHAWITCSIPDPTSSAPAPVITSVNFSGYQLVGTLPASFASLRNLTSLDLSNNDLSGPLPEWLTSMTALRLLDVENNNFSGPIPEGLLSANSLIRFTYDGNPFLGNQSAPAITKCTSSNCGKSHKRIIAGAIVGAVVGFALITVIAILVWKRKRQLSDEEPSSAPTRIVTPDRAEAYTFVQVAEATANFTSRELGKGAFGTVYYGQLPDGKEVAVKVADENSQRTEREFFAEVEVLLRVHHNNLVALVGYCQEQRQVLIYEYMGNGSLFGHLHGFGDDTGTSVRSGIPNWGRRLNIALNVAQGLEYLHTACSPVIIHRDVKSENILLTTQFQAKLADFGSTKLVVEANGTRQQTDYVVGTLGYIDPEYFESHQVSTQSDVYSFGIVLLELITGGLPIDSSSPNGRDENLGNWVRKSHQNNNIISILDPTLTAANTNMEAILEVVEVAIESVKPQGDDRPSMIKVVEELKLALAIQNTNVPSTHASTSHSLQSLGRTDYYSGSYEPTSFSIVTPLTA